MAHGSQDEPAAAAPGPEGLVAHGRQPAGRGGTEPGAPVAAEEPRRPRPGDRPAGGTSDREPPSPGTSTPEPPSSGSEPVPPTGAEADRPPSAGPRASTAAHEEPTAAHAAKGPDSARPGDGPTPSGADREPPAGHRGESSPRPTSRDVARAAGVSQATVSLVLGEKWRGRVSERTAGLVRDAARELGYRPNLAARNLRLGRTRTALLVVPALTNEFFARVYTGAATVAAEHGFGVVLYPSPKASGLPGTPSPPPVPHSTG